MSKWQSAYEQKRMSAEQAVSTVKDGDWIEYSHFVTVPWDLDAALAKRKDELKKVYIKTATLTYLPEVFKVDPQGETFLMTDGSFSGVTRQLKSKGEIYVNNSLYHEGAEMHRKGFLKNQFIFVAVTPMDNNGYFGMSTTASALVDMFRAKQDVNPGLKVILEVNPALPQVQGDHYLHISEIDAVVETSQPRKPTAIPAIEPTEIDEKIANLIMGEMVNGACLQLGIGGMPNLVGKMIANSDLKDLGCHSEMFVDAYMDLFHAGKLTNNAKQQDIGKSVFTFGMGSAELYEFMDNNPSLRCLPVSYTNNPGVIARNKRVYSICSCLAVDMFGNVSSESVGFKQVSGTGGQWDYHYASLHSEGGKGFVCMPSAKMGKDGKLVSNVVLSHTPGTQITVSGNTTNYVVTEYGIANLKALPTWQRVEALVGIAHPDCRDDLFRQAEENRLWRPQNKKI
jgi:Acetyl-CoA hydrolase